MKISKNFCLVLSLVLVVACNNQKPTENLQQKDANNDAVKIALASHIEFLSDDLLKGRDTGSKEYEIAARYVVSYFKQLGLTPAGENNSWYQNIPFTRSSLDSGSAEMILHTNTVERSFNYPEQFMIGASAVAESEEVRGQVVFAGYGIVSNELKHNDYFDLDVKGKIVAILAGRPAAFPSEIGAHVSNSDEKKRYATEHGAIGIITLHTNLADKVLPYEKAIPYAAVPSLKWQMKDGSIFGSYPQIKGNVYVSKETGKALFAAAGKDLNDVFKAIEKDEVPIGFDMGIEVTLKKNSTHEKVTSSNVIAKLEGSDPALKNEYILYTAHLDHIGDKIHTDSDDHINNGALDNASGVAIILETARRFAAENPKRSILFAVVTAEEKGLLGSDYFAHYPTVPITSIVANINLDMPLILYPFADVVAFGSQHSTMAGFVEQATAIQGLKLSPDPIPEMALFVRSDHYSYVKQGIPSIFLVPGWTSTDPEVDGSKVFADFFSKHYHQPSDEASLPINYEAGAVFTTVNFNIGNEIANSKNRPHWNEGDYFGDTFKK